jgi:hypothetical protein
MTRYQKSKRLLSELVFFTLINWILKDVYLAQVYPFFTPNRLQDIKKNIFWHYVVIASHALACSIEPLVGSLFAL